MGRSAGIRSFAAAVVLAAWAWVPALPAAAASGSDGPVAKTGNGDDRWTALGRRIGCNGQVIAAVAAPDGSIYYGGGFTHCGNVAASNVARYDPATQVWSSLGTGPDQGTQGGIVRALAIGSDALYLGGEFTNAGGQSASLVARYSLTTGRFSTLGSGIEPGGAVHAIAVDGDQVYAGGAFLRAGGVTANFVARYDAARGAWYPLGSGAANGVGGGSTPDVLAIAVAGTGVYVGGRFVTAGGQPNLRIARYVPAADAWFPVAGGIGSQVEEIAVVGDDVFVAGAFAGAFTAGGLTIDTFGIARYRASSNTWAALGSGASNGVSGNVQALVHAGGILYVGGDFIAAGGSSAQHVARYTIAQDAWSQLVPDPVSVSSEVESLALAGSTLYAAGPFVLAGGLVANQVARFSVGGSSWLPLDPQSNGVGGGIVNAVARAGDHLVACGSFAEAGGISADRVAMFDTTTQLWSAMGDGLDSTCYAAAAIGNRVFVGGEFTSAGGITAVGVAEYDIDEAQWKVLGTGSENGVGGLAQRVSALAVDGSDVYVAGHFGTAGLVSANSVARYDANSRSWSRLGGASDNGVNGAATAIVASGGIVHVGGTFTQAGGVSANRIARFASGAWSSLGTGAANGVDAAVNAIAVRGSSVYAGGDFLLAGGVGAKYVARYDTGSQGWFPLGTGAANGANATVSDLVTVGALVYAGGYFTTMNGAPALYAARYDEATNTWHTLGSGVTSVVNGFALAEPLLHVGGGFGQAGAVFARNVASYDVRGDVTTTLDASASAFAVGTSVTLTANVSVAAFPLAPGAVTFLDGADPIDACSAVALAGSGATRTATCSTSALGVGTRNLYARYAGDATNAADTSLARTVAVSAPTITLGPSVLPEGVLGASYAQTIVASGSSGAQPPYAYHVTAGALPPGLAFTTGGNLAGTPTAVGSFAFTLAASDTSARDLGGPFLGERGHALVIRGLPTTTSVTSDADPALVNSTVTLTATVSGSAPTGTVTFLRDGTALPGGTVSLAGTGDVRTATYATSTLAVGERSIVAVYAGDATNDTSTSASYAQTIEPPTITVAPATLPDAFTGVPYFQQLSAGGAGASTPFGFDNGGFQGAPPLPPGLTLLASDGQISGTPQQTGSYPFTIRGVDASPALVGGPFIGQRGYTIDVQLQPTTTTISSIAPSPATQAEPYTVTVDVTGMVGAPGGTVAVSDGVGASCFVTLSSGSGSCQMATGAVGPRTISASYGGLPPHAPSTGSTTLQVNPSSTASASRLSVGARVGVRGQTVAVPVTFRGDGTTVQVTAQITFDKERLAFVSAQGIGGASCVRLVAPNDDRVSFRAPDTPTGQPLSPNLDTRYCELTFRIADTAPGATYALGILTNSCQDGAGIQRVCTTQNGAVSVSAVETSSPNLALLAISGYEDAVTARRSVRVTNRGDVALTFDCAVFGPQAFALDAGASATVPPQLDELVVVSCALPPLGTTLSGQLVCTTSDAARPTLQYGLTCQRVANGTPLPGDQIFDDGLKQGDQLGTSTAVSQAEAGSILVVGAPFAGGDADGRVLIYESARAGVLQPASLRDGKRTQALDAMRRVAVLAPPRSAVAAAGIAKGGGSIGDKFGQAVAVSPNGDRVAVGAPLAGGSGAGQVLIYARPANGWEAVNLGVPDATIDAPSLAGSSVSEFGASLAFFADGDLAIGAPGTASGVSGVGAAFVYNAGAGTTYARSETLLSTAPQGQGRFGESVAASVEAGAGQLVVGAPQEGPLGQQTGNAYVYPIANGAVGLPQRVASSEPATGDKWGSAVAVRHGVVVIGAVGDDTDAGVDSGSATVFRRRPDGSGVDPVTTLEPGPGTAQGAGAAVATNGDLVIVGAPLATVGGRIGQGRIYLYDVEDAFTTREGPVQTLENNDGRADDAFGRALAINRRNVLAGVPLDDREVDPATQITDVGRADPFVLDRILRAGFE